MPEPHIVLRAAAMLLAGRRVWEGWSWAIVDGDAVLEHSSGYYGNASTARTIAQWRLLGWRQQREARPDA